MAADPVGEEVEGQRRGGRRCEVVNNADGRATDTSLWLMVRLVSALSVIVLRIGPVTVIPTPGLTNVAAAGWLSPSSRIVVIVPAAVVLAPFASRILTAPSCREQSRFA